MDHRESCSNIGLIRWLRVCQHGFLPSKLALFHWLAGVTPARGIVSREPGIECCGGPISGCATKG